MPAANAPLLGLAVVPTLAPERLQPAALAAEQAGLDELWVWEDCFKQSAIASAAAALAWTRRLRIGIGLMPVPLRNIALTAMEITTIERMFPGRCTPGIGHGVQDWMGQVGARVDSPMTLLREYTVTLRRLLRGERVTFSGRYVHLDGVQLDWPPVTLPPLLIGGGGKRSLALAGELGDGILLGTAMRPDEVAESFATALAAISDSGRLQPTERRRTVATLNVAVGRDAAERMAAELPRWGRSSDEPIGATGDAGQIAAAVAELADAGASSVVFQPTADEPDLPGLIEFLGAQVAPLVRR